MDICPYGHMEQQFTDLETGFHLIFSSGNNSFAFIRDEIS